MILMYQLLANRLLGRKKSQWEMIIVAVLLAILIVEDDESERSCISGRLEEKYRFDETAEIRQINKIATKGMISSSV